METLLDAWLDRRDPRIRLLDRATGRPLAGLDGHALQVALEDAGLDARDFLDPTPARRRELAALLFGAAGPGGNLQDSRQGFAILSR